MAAKISPSQGSSFIFAPVALNSTASAPPSSLTLTLPKIGLVKSPVSGASSGNGRGFAGLANRFSLVSSLALAPLSLTATLSITGDAMGRPLADALERLRDEVDVSSVLSFGSTAAIFSQTVKEQISNLLERLAVRNRAALAEIATELRIFGTTIDESWLAHLFTQAPFGIALMRGPEHRIEVTNEYYRRSLGGRELVGKTLREAFPEWTQESYALFDRVYQTGEQLDAHEYGARWDRSGRGPEDGYADGVIQALRDEAGEVNGLLVMYTDVTDAVRARRRAAELAAEHRGILDLVPSALVVTDMAGTIVRANAAARSLFGDLVREGTRYVETIANWRLRDRATGRTLAPAERPLARALAGSDVASADLTVEPREGQPFDVRISAMCLRDDAGAQRGAAVILSPVEDAAA